MNQRIARIEEMLKDAPEDQFLRYSLAMELRKEGESDRCTQLFQSLTNDDPPHVPAFLMLAQYFVEHDRASEAKAVLVAGISTAGQQGEPHAAGEMSELLGTLKDV